MSRFWMRQVRISENVAHASGGALHVSNGSITLANQSQLIDNHALGGGRKGGAPGRQRKLRGQEIGGGYGNNIYVESSGVVIYALPAPPGYWISDPVRCRSELDAESSSSGNSAACGELDPTHAGYTVRLLAQPIDEELPYACAPGLVGSTLKEASQSSPLCEGACPSGFFCEARTPNGPTPCPLGHYCERGSPQAVPCPAGTYNPDSQQEAASACRLCRRGTYCGVGERKEQPCPINSWSSKLQAPNASVCTSCPENAVTNGTGSTDPKQCKCAKDFYAEGSRQAFVCKRCFLGTQCDESGSRLETLFLKPGFYRRGANSTDVRRCADASAGCSDSRSGCSESQSGCVGGSDASRLCRDTLAGVFCESCASWLDEDGGFGRRLEFYVGATDDSPARCELCKPTDLLWIFAVPVAVVLGVLLFTWLARQLEKWPRLRALWDLMRGVVQRYTLTTKIKVLIGFYQITTKVEKVYEVRLPAVVRDLLATFSVPLSMGVGDLSLACIYRHGYTPQLAALFFLPLLLIASWVAYQLLRTSCESATSKRKRKGWLQRLFRRLLPTVLRLLFLAYPLVTTLAFEAFSCTPPFDDGSTWLIADVAMRCDSPEHYAAQRFAWAAILVYPVGSWVLNAVLLFCARKAIVEKEESALSLATSFLHREYRTSVFCWELMEMGRRFLLVGLFVYVPYLRGSMMQLALATVVCVAYLVVQLVAMPYHQQSDNFLALACSTNIVMLFLGCILFKFDALSSTQDIIDVMGDEQAAVYDLEELTLTYILVACILGVLVISGVIIVVQGALEARKRRKEAAAKMARMLRYRKSGQPAVVSPLSGDERFHVFLSHTWSQGQSDMRVVKTRLLDLLPGARVFLDVDDLSTGSGAEFVDACQAVLCYCTRRYLGSRACARELLRAVLQNKPLIAMLEPERTEARGGLTLHECRSLLVEQAYASVKGGPSAPKDRDWASQWELEGEVQQWGVAWGHGDDLAPPTPLALFEALSQHAPIEWNRMTAFQDVSVRLVAERLLPASSRGARGPVYVQDELAEQALRFAPLPPGRTRHLYVSRHNHGAQELCRELRTLVGPMLQLSDDLGELEACEHMLLYLTSETWTRGAASARFARDVAQALTFGVPLLLAHELPSALDDSQARHACEFNDFWAEGWTPRWLLSGEANVYKRIATSLKGGAWRPIGLAKLAAEIAKGGGPRTKVHVVPDDGDDTRLDSARRKKWGVLQRTRLATSRRSSATRAGSAYSSVGAPAGTSGGGGGAGAGMRDPTRRRSLSFGRDPPPLRKRGGAGNKTGAAPSPARSPMVTLDVEVAIESDEETEPRVLMPVDGGTMDAAVYGGEREEEMVARAESVLLNQLIRQRMSRVEERAARQQDADSDSDEAARVAERAAESDDEVRFAAKAFARGEEHYV